MEEYHLQKEKRLCFTCNSPGHQASECKQNRETKDEDSKDTPTSGLKAHMAHIATLQLVNMKRQLPRGLVIKITIVTASG